MLENFALPSKDLYELLKVLGVESLYHANTLTTSVSFIKGGALLSRKYIEVTDGLHQTSQVSDEIDKYHDVWDSVFLDGTDHHLLFNRRNYYGPILFKMKLDLLLSDEFQDVYITRGNPSKWGMNPNIKEEQKYYSSIEEVKKDYTAGGKKEDAQIMFTFRDPGKKLNFDKYLETIVYDDPRIKVSFLNTEEEGRVCLKKCLEVAARNYGGSGYKIEMRSHHGKTCKCLNYYSELRTDDIQELKKCFDIKAHFKNKISQT